MRAVFLALILCASAASVAAAQPVMAPPGSAPVAPTPAPAPAPTVRSGLLVGGDVGVGDLRSESGITDCGSCQSDPPAVGGRLELGAMLTPRFALITGIDISAKSLDANHDDGIAQQMLLIEAMYWSSSRLWMSAGVGRAKLMSTCNGCDSSSQLDSAVGFDGGLGYELISSRRFALDVRLRVTAAHFADLDDTLSTTTFALGLRWFSAR